MDFDDILKEIGGWGLYQKLRVVLLGLVGSWICTSGHFTIALMLLTPPFWCQKPNQLEINHTTDRGLTLSQLLDEEIMANPADQDQCATLNAGNATHHQNFGPNQCNSEGGIWHFDLAVTGETLISQYSLVCDQHWWASIAITFYIMGDIVGSLLLPLVIDRYGRKPTFVAVWLIHLVFGSVAVLVPSVHGFIAFRFLQSLSIGTGFIVTFVWALEMVSPEKRTTTVLIIQALFGLTVAFEGFFAWLCKQWVYYGLVVNIVPFLCGVMVLIIVPESPRWLLSVGGDRKRISATLHKIARENGTVSKVDIVSTFLNEKAEEEELEHKPKQQLAFSILIKTRNLREKLAMTSLTYFAIHLIYNLFQYNAENLPGNPHIVFMLGGLVDIPAVLLIFSVADRIGSIRLMSILFWISAAAAIATPVIAELTSAEDSASDYGGVNWYVVGVALVAKMANCVIFNVSCQLMSEHFPTAARGKAAAFGSLVAKVGYLTMPLVKLTANYYRYNTMIISGILSVIFGIVIVSMPEMSGHDLPETVQDSIDIGWIGMESVRVNLGLRKRAAVIRSTRLTQTRLLSATDMDDATMASIRKDTTPRLASVESNGEGIIEDSINVHFDIL